MTFINLSSNKDVQGPVIIEPDVYGDSRGYFMESFKENAYEAAIGDTKFIQDNESKSSYGVLRGLHFQKPPYAQAKLVRVVKGAAVDVIVDIRKDSPTYRQWYWCYLSEENHRQFFVPRGFAHGFVSLRDDTIFQYKCDNIYNKESEGAIYYNDPNINIPWHNWVNEKDIKLSDKDKCNKFLEDIENPF